MFEYLYQNYSVPGFFRLFGFITFRALAAGIFSLLFSFLIGAPLIRRLQKLKFKEVIRSDGPNSHQSKAGTPTMGGILILLSLSVSCLLFGNFRNLHFVLIFVFTLLFGAIGFFDDYSKVVRKKKNGMSARVKMFLTLLFAASFSLLYYAYTPSPPASGLFSVQLPNGMQMEIPIVSYDITGVFVPFVKGQFLNLGIFLAIPFWIIVLVGTSHSVNLTDGLDGLAIGVIITTAVALGAVAYITGTPNWAYYLNLPMVMGATELTVFLSALTGAGIGFLWYNAPPAQIFMGDTGSLSLGSALGMSAIVLKKELLLLIAGGVFVMEALSVILQVLSFKLRKKRIFKMAPLHHHFELKGWPETRVVIRFWLMGIIFCLIALSTIRIQ